MPIASAAQAQSPEIDDLQARLDALRDDSSSYVQKNSAQMAFNTSSMGMEKKESSASNKIPIK